MRILFEGLIQRENMAASKQAYEASVSSCGRTLRTKGKADVVIPLSTCGSVGLLTEFAFGRVGVERPDRAVVSASPG